MLISKNDIIQGKHDKPIVLDFGYVPSGIKKPIVVFAHGFKGFKDWGHFNKVMEFFIENGFAFVKFNFSHNGGTVEQPIDFPDLEAFGNNNFTKELDDLRSVIDWISDNNEIPVTEIDTEQIYLIGHSRGGGVAILAASEDDRIKKLVTWAAVSDVVNRYATDVMEHWKKEGVLYIANGRTKQQMPLYYQLAEDTIKNKDRFNIEKACNKITIPHLIIHGTSDEVVPVAEAKNIYKWSKHSEIVTITNGNHTFGAAHPYLENTLIGDVEIVLKASLGFFKD